MKQDTINSLNRYATHRIPPGSFLQAVLENDLQGAFGRADERNREDLFEIVKYCHNNLSYNCWGSPDAVKNWLKRKEK